MSGRLHVVLQAHLLGRHPVPVDCQDAVPRPRVPVLGTAHTPRVHEVDAVPGPVVGDVRRAENDDGGGIVRLHRAGERAGRLTIAT